MYFYCFFSFEYFDPYNHYAACWVTLNLGITANPLMYLLFPLYIISLFVHWEIVLELMIRSLIDLCYVK